MWPTPNTPSGGPNTKSTPTHTGGMDLEGAVAMWATPSVADVTGGHMTRGGARGGELLLRGQAKGFPSSLPGDSPNEHGAPCSRSGQTSPRRLNPLFVEWLMGWPLGWTEAGSPLPETEWSRWWQHMRGSLSALGWRI